jgi:hypothetical protein
MIIAFKVEEKVFLPLEKGAAVFWGPKTPLFKLDLE